MLAFNSWLMLASTCMLGIWVLTLPARSVLYSIAALAMPLVLSLLIQDWLVRQSLSLWLQMLQPFAPLFALWFCIEAAYIIFSRHRYWHLILPTPWLALLYWQLQCLQSGILPWPFFMQLLSVAFVMTLVVGTGQFVVRQNLSPKQVSSTARALTALLAALQWGLAWWLACRLPERGTDLQADYREAFISIMVLILFIAAGALFERLRPRPSLQTSISGANE